jgi:hypothetical protein
MKSAGTVGLAQPVKKEKKDKDLKLSVLKPVSPKPCSINQY